ncbi:hypothetical protein [uncultured Microbulbifer sp.]|uniref:hypothetical protein n=1 Tax=uncultured Microbulbifer sp. TaxID=348147 RepID=UPI00262972D1|nr:hypothetical protein [uncultured Microbulbifer sp.]
MKVRIRRNSKSVIVALFTSFPGIHKIAAQWLCPNGLGASLLTAKDNEPQM